MSKKTTTMYLHGSKEYALEVGTELGLERGPLDKFMYALYEVAFKIEVDMETGDYKIIGVKE